MTNCDAESSTRKTRSKPSPEVKAEQPQLYSAVSAPDLIESKPARASIAAIIISFTLGVVICSAVSLWLTPTESKVEKKWRLAYEAKKAEFSEAESQMRRELEASKAVFDKHADRADAVHDWWMQQLSQRGVLIWHPPSDPQFYGDTPEPGFWWFADEFAPQ